MYNSNNYYNIKISLHNYNITFNFMGFVNDTSFLPLINTKGRLYTINKGYNIVLDINNLNFINHSHSFFYNNTLHNIDLLGLFFINNIQINNQQYKDIRIRIGKVNNKLFVINYISNIIK